MPGASRLPQRATHPEAKAALHKLAAIGRTHHDLWIEDMLVAPPTAAQLSADQALADALSASSAGNTDQSLAASATAMHLYRVLGNQPGYLRAAVEHLYNLQRMGLNEDCLREINALHAEKQLSRYAWLTNYLELETSAAYSMLGDAPRARAAATEAAAAADAAALPISRLRAQSFIVDNDIWLKHYNSALNEAALALRSSEEVHGASMARFQLLSGLSFIAKELDLPRTRAGLAEAAANAALANINRKTAAYAMEELGLDDLQTGDLGGAERSFRTADSLLAGLGTGAAARRYAADWNTDRALLLARRHGPAAGVQMLAREELDYQQFDAVRPRLHFYTEYADLLRQSQNTQASLHEILFAVADAERSLGQIHTAAEGRSWPQETHKAYEVLVDDLSEDPANAALALRAWEWLQSAPYRGGQPPAPDSSIAALDRILPPLPATSRGHLTLVIAKVLDRYIAWSISGDPQAPVRQRVLSITPATAARRIDTFLQLCANPHSSINDLSILGQSIYDDLLAPFDDQITKADQLDLDVDASLATMPFAALQRHGHYLGLDHPLDLLPSSWILRHPATLDSLYEDHLPPKPHLIIIQESPLASHPRIPAEYDESTGILRPLSDCAAATSHDLARWFAPCCRRFTRAKKPSASRRHCPLRRPRTRRSFANVRFCRR